jgi:hypothetical protein
VKARGVRKGEDPVGVMKEGEEKEEDEEGKVEEDEEKEEEDEVVATTAEGRGRRSLRKGKLFCSTTRSKTQIN